MVRELPVTNEYVFNCTPSQILRALPINADIDAALERIEELRREGRVRVVKLREVKKSPNRCP